MERGNGAEPRIRRTGEDLVAHKLLVNHLGVHLDEAPVLGVAERRDRDLDRRRVKGPADGAQPRRRAELGGPGVEHVQPDDPIRRPVRLAGDLVAPRGGQVPVELAVPDCDVASEFGDFGRHVLDGPGVAPGAKRHHVLLELAAIGVFHALVIGEGRRRVDDVRAREQGDILGVAGEAEIQRACALIVGHVTRRDGEAECGAEVLPVFRNAVGGGVQRGEPGSATKTFVNHLDKGHLGLEKARFGENRLDTDGSSDSVVVV